MSIIHNQLRGYLFSILSEIITEMVTVMVLAVMSASTYSLVVGFFRTLTEVLREKKSRSLQPADSKQEKWWS